MEPPQIDIDGIVLEECHTDKSDFMLYWYPRDYNRQKVKKELAKNRMEIVDNEYEEGGMLEILYLNRE